MSNTQNKPIPASLPMGFADQVLDLEMKLQDDQSLEVIQILSQMYKIAVDYYIEGDVKKASYFQKKLNLLTVKSLTAPSIEKVNPFSESKTKKKIKQQVDKFVEYETAYLKTIVQKTEQAQKKMKEFVRADLNRQQERFQGRMLKRFRSAGKIM